MSRLLREFFRPQLEAKYDPEEEDKTKKGEKKAEKPEKKEKGDEPKKEPKEEPKAHGSGHGSHSSAKPKASPPPRSAQGPEMPDVPEMPEPGPGGDDDGDDQHLMSPEFEDIIKRFSEKICSASGEGCDAAAVGDMLRDFAVEMETQEGEDPEEDFHDDEPDHADDGMEGFDETACGPGMEDEGY